jgi:serine phosphatase RsbU (regulator of sigma subunit)
MNKEFKDEELKIQKGDMIYLFSDGYSDQFGEQNKKKFSTKRFKKLLTDISGKSIEEQFELLDNAFNDWKGKEDQIDDVLVIAIQI